MSYMREVKTLVPVDVDPEDLVTIAEAAGILKVSIQAVAGAVDSGSFKTLIIDTNKAVKQRGVRGRRLLLRAEVLDRKYARG